MSDDKKISDQVAIEKEKQKTKRYLIFAVSFAVIAIIGIVLVLNKAGAGGTGSIDLDFSKGKLSLQLKKPIVKQTNQPTAEYKSNEGNVEFTTGKVDRKIINELEQADIPVPMDNFTGNNYINTELGFLLTINNPEEWNVTYDPTGKSDPFYPVNTIYTNDAVKSHLNINIDRLLPGQDLQSSIMAQLQSLVDNGIILQLPAISYDANSETIFLSYYNQNTQGATYQKIVLDGRDYYVATANFNDVYTPAARVDDLIEMVASFTLISG